nr:RNA-guided endonuclease TnpB family protein [Streptomyces sp. YIM 121038]
MELTRGFRFALDVSPRVGAELARHAGAARWAYNYALAKKTASYRAWAQRRNALVDAGVGKAEASKRLRAQAALRGREAAAWEYHRKVLVSWTRRNPKLVREPANADPEVLARLRELREDVERGSLEHRRLLAEARAWCDAAKGGQFAAGDRFPSAMDICALWRDERDVVCSGEDGPWHGEVSSYAFSGGFDRAERAWKNWTDSLAGLRAGRAVGFPRFKKKGRSTDSFMLCHDVNHPAIRIEQHQGAGAYHYLQLPKIGRVRTWDDARRLAKLVKSGRAVISSVTISRAADRWYASVVCRIEQDVPVAFKHTAADGTSALYLSHSEAITAAAACAKQALAAQAEQHKRRGDQQAAAKLAQITHALAPCSPGTCADAAERARARQLAQVHGGPVQRVGKNTPTQRVGGLVGVDLGSKHLATLTARLDQSDPGSMTVAAPKSLNTMLGKLARAQQVLSRKMKSSGRRQKAARRVARIHHKVALHRAGALHDVSKRLTTGFTQVAIENLNLVQLTASSKGTAENPGKNVKVKAAFNRHLLDSALGELRRQLTYKSLWYGSELLVLDKGSAPNQTCGQCGERNPNSPPLHARFTCFTCGHTADRTHNSASAIRRLAREQIAAVASDRGDTQNARRASVRPDNPRETGHGAMKREDPGHAAGRGPSSG